MRPRWPADILVSTLIVMLVSARPSTERKVDPITDSVFLTGATGFVGMELLARYLERTDRRVYALVRGADDREAAARMERTLLPLFGPGASVCASGSSPCAGDITRPGLGLRGRRRPHRRARGGDRPRRGVGVVRDGAAGGAHDQRGRHSADARVRGALPRPRRPAALLLHLDGIRRRRACGLLQRGRPRRGTALSQHLRAVEVRGGVPRRRARAGSCRSRCCARASSSASATAAGRRRSTSSTGRCARSRAAPMRRCRRARDAPVDVVPVDYVADATFALTPGAGGGGRDLPPDRRARTRAASASSWSSPPSSSDARLRA